MRSADGPLPHGLGWFVQTYRGEPVVWQFGMGANASSSLVMTLPARGITLVLVANSDGLAKPATLAAGDITVVAVRASVLPGADEMTLRYTNRSDWHS